MTGTPTWHPTTVSKDVVSLGDRLAILNLLGVYSYYCNDGDINGWGSLFAEDSIYDI